MKIQKLVLSFLSIAVALLILPSSAEAQSRATDTLMNSDLIQPFLPDGVTPEEADLPTYLAAVAAAVEAEYERSPVNADRIADIVTAAILLRPELIKEIITTALGVMGENGQDDPDMVAYVVTSVLNSLPERYSAAIMVAARDSAPWALRQIEFAFVQFQNRIPENELRQDDPDTNLELGGDTRLGEGLEPTPTPTPTPTPAPPPPSPTPTPVTPVLNN